MRKYKNPNGGNTISFTDWLKKHKNRNSPLGDLARDSMADPSWPQSSNITAYQNHLSIQRVHWKVQKVLTKAWKSYEAYIKRQNSPSAPRKQPSKKKPDLSSGRRVTYVKDAIPLSCGKRTIEKFQPGDEAWISWDGAKALPVIVTEMDEIYYTFRIERPLKDAGKEHFVRLDEVRSTPELACINYVS